MKNLNKILAITAIATCGFFFGGAGIASAQVSASDSITVSAANEGTFTFAITQATYGFGTVNADGATTGDSTGVNGTTGSVFTKASASAFTVASSPVRTVNIFNASTVSTTPWGTAASLKMQIPAVGAGTSCGYIAFDVVGNGTATCSLGNLIHAMSVGNDDADVDGNIDLQLTVANTDSVGSNSWTVNLTASAL